MWTREDRQIRDLRRGDANAFAVFVDTHGPAILRLARRYARTEADAEDLTQEIFVALSQALPTFRGDSKLTTWVYRVAINRCLKHIERRRPESLPLDERTLPTDPAAFDSPFRSAERSELSAQVAAALDGLSGGHREVVILHELHGLTYDECAAALGIPAGTVKSRLSNAFTKLRTSLGAYVRGEDTAIPESSRIAAGKVAASPGAAATGTRR